MAGLGMVADAPASAGESPWLPNFSSCPKDRQAPRRASDGLRAEAVEEPDVAAGFHAPRSAGQNTPQGPTTTSRAVLDWFRHRVPALYRTLSAVPRNLPGLRGSHEGDRPISGAASPKR